MDLQSTVLFLKSLTEVNQKIYNDDYLSTALREALSSDGYSLIPTQNHFLRGLGEEPESPNSPDFVMNIMLVLMCVMCAGFASGLTQGLLSLDFMEMTIKSRSGTAIEKENAAKVLPVIKNHHLLLVTLMLWNASATEALPIFLNKLVPEWLAIIISVTMVLFVGEIIPASILTGPNQLSIASKLLPLVYFVLVLFAPIAWPISKLLDYLIGHDSGMTMYNRTEIHTMMALQHEEGVKRQSEFGGAHGLDAVHHEEVTIIGGALKFREMAVSEVMTPVSEVYMISATETLSYKTLYEIFKSGYSRIPVFDTDHNDIIGLILAKDLIFVDAEDETPVRNFIELFGRKPAVVWHDDKLGETLSMFRQHRSHMAIVRDVVSKGLGDPVYAVVGIITLEDIIEEILGAEIVDETDNMADSDLFKANPQFRDMDFARLKLLHNKRSDADGGLSPDEVRAVVAHLSANVPQIQNLFGSDTVGLTELVKRSVVMSAKRKTAEGAKPCQEDMLYRRGKVSSMCTLVLSGTLTVLAGKDEFQSEKGPWSTLAADALTVTEGTYIPDYSAYISSESIRFVSLSMSVQNIIKEQLSVNYKSGSFGETKELSGSFSQQPNSGSQRRKSATRNQSFLGAHSLTERKNKQRRENNFSGDYEGSGTGNPLLLAALLGGANSPPPHPTRMSRQSTLDSQDLNTSNHDDRDSLSTPIAPFPIASGATADDDYHLYQEPPASGSDVAKRESIPGSVGKKKIRFHESAESAFPHSEHEQQDQKSHTDERTVSK